MNTTDVLALIAVPDIAYYEQQAESLYKSCCSMEADALKRIRKFHPNAEKLIAINQPSNDFSNEDARLSLAREHGFENAILFHAHITGLSDPDSAISRFEQAVDAMIGGNVAVLGDLIKSDAALVRQRSTRAHNATLLHYVSANGIENFRQKTPANALQIADLLLSAGSEPDAPANTYDTNWCTTMDLLVSSNHPHQAGLQCELVEKLLDFGAAVDGPSNNCSPLTTAIYFNYPKAAETLVRRGARIANLVTAAAMGDLDFVKQYLHTDGSVSADLPFLKLPWLKRSNTIEEELALAFVWAAMHNRAEMVALLLDCRVSPASRDLRQWTALHWAAHYGHLEVVELLLKHKAPLEARNEFGGTVLDQTLWATVHEGLRDTHSQVIRKLLRAGARVHPWWLFDNLTPPLDPAIAALLTDSD